MNPLPNRPLLNNPSLPLALPNLPALDQPGFNGRPRKFAPDVEKDYFQPNGNLNLGSTPSSGPPPSLPSLLDREREQRERLNLSMSIPHESHAPHEQMHPGHPDHNEYKLIHSGESNFSHERDMELEESSQLTAIFRPDDSSDESTKSTVSRFSSFDPASSSSSSSSTALLGHEDGMEPYLRDEDEDLKEDDHVLDEDAVVEHEGDGKVWKVRRTLRR